MTEVYTAPNLYPTNTKSSKAGVVIAVIALLIAIAGLVIAILTLTKKQKEETCPDFKTCELSTKSLTNSGQLTTLNLSTTSLSANSTISSDLKATTITSSNITNSSGINTNSLSLDTLSSRNANNIINIPSNLKIEGYVSATSIDFSGQFSETQAVNNLEVKQRLALQTVEEFVNTNKEISLNNTINYIITTGFTNSQQNNLIFNLPPATTNGTEYYFSVNANQGDTVSTVRVQIRVPNGYSYKNTVLNTFSNCTSASGCLYDLITISDKINHYLNCKIIYINKKFFVYYSTNQPLVNSNNTGFENVSVYSLPEQTFNIKPSQLLIATNQTYFLLMNNPMISSTTPSTVNILAPALASGTVFNYNINVMGYANKVNTNKINILYQKNTILKSGYTSDYETPCSENTTVIDGVEYCTRQLVLLKNQNTYFLNVRLIYSTQSRIICQVDGTNNYSFIQANTIQSDLITNAKLTTVNIPKQSLFYVGNTKACAESGCEYVRYFINYIPERNTYSFTLNIYKTADAVGNPDYAGTNIQTIFGNNVDLVFFMETLFTTNNNYQYEIFLEKSLTNNLQGLYFNMITAKKDSNTYSRFTIYNFTETNIKVYGRDKDSFSIYKTDWDPFTVSNTRYRWQVVATNDSSASRAACTNWLLNFMSNNQLLIYGY